MRGPCAIIAFIRATGRSPVLEFLEDLERRQPENYAKWLFERDLIEEFGTDIGLPHWDPLGDGLGEIRWRFGRLRMRIYCSEEANREVVMLHAAIKKWRAFDREDRQKCVERRSEFRSASYNQLAREYLRRRKMDDA